jgi:radical SAM superfamily enzyme YgiQ (UPF0313 family)
MNILLVYPEMPDTLYAMKHFLKVTGKKAAYPPLGLLTVASMLPDAWNKKLVDMNVRDLTNADLEWADYVFLSAMNVQEHSVRQIVAFCVQMNKPIVAGGSLFTHEYERFPQIDHFVLNEAEITLPLFLADLANGAPAPIYKSTHFANVEETPLPAFELVNMKHYLYSIVQYSRGCPYMCDFCDVTALYGRKPRTKTTEQIIAELDIIRTQKNISFVLFADDNLIGNKKILKSDLLPALVKWRQEHKPYFYFATQLTINLADDEELMQLLLDAGFRHIFVGIETPDEDALFQSGKKQNLKRSMLGNVQMLHQKGFIISAGFIVGFDSDKPTTFTNQASFIQESGIPFPIVNLLKAPPGTELYTRIKMEGRLSKPFAFLEGDTNIVPVMPLEDLNNGFKELIGNIYLPKYSYERITEFFKTYRFPKTTIRIKEKLNLGMLLILARVFFKMGVTDPNRKYFWKLFFETLKHNRKYADKAIFYGILMHQMACTHQNLVNYLDEQKELALPQPAVKRVMQEA